MFLYLGIFWVSSWLSFWEVCGYSHFLNEEVTSIPAQTPTWKTRVFLFIYLSVCPERETQPIATLLPFMFLILTNPFTMIRQ
jgi:hypothetical protein